MDVPTMEMDRAEAAARAEEYRRALRRRADEEYEAVLAGLERMASGESLLSLRDAMRTAGADRRGRPRLAVARADREQVQLNLRRGRTFVEFDARSPRATVRSDTLEVRVDVGGAPPTEEWSDYRQMERWYALVPMVPPGGLRKIGGASYLRDHFILWEVEEWSPTRIEADPPTDPLLLKRIGGGDLHAVLYAWDLTDLERSVMRGRAARSAAEAFRNFAEAERQGLPWSELQRARARVEEVYARQILPVLRECRWQGVGAELKRCPLCQTAALEGEDTCSGCGAGPFDDETWREERTTRNRSDGEEPETDDLVLIRLDTLVEGLAVSRFLLTERGEAVGCVELEWPSSSAGDPTVCNLFVRPEYRRRGHGRRLLRAAEEAAGSEMVELACRPDTWLEEWYEREGYKRSLVEGEERVWLVKAVT
ncbi:MAG: GNAT family N-acetyltransferase [Longimicrobiales bacterium]